MVIYLVHNEVNKKYYVGWTGMSFDERWYQHCYEANHGSKFYLHKAIKKYGKESFTYEILARVQSEREAKQLESLWIITLRSYDSKIGYNMTYGGEGAIGYKHSEEAKRKISEWHKRNSYLRGKPAWNRGLISPRRGKNHTWGNKISEALLGNTSPQRGKTRVEISGLTVAREVSKRIANSKTGKVFITDGNVSKLVTRETLLPNGWRYGLTR